MEQHGVREPVVLFEGKILDGRNRYRASRDADVECAFVTYDGDDPVGYVVSLNLRRRHLTHSQRAWAAAKLANVPRGGDRRSDQSARLHSGSRTTNENAARLLDVSRRSVATARSVRDHGTPELHQKVEAGTVSVSAAADIATLPRDDQQEIVAKGEAEILAIAKRLRTEKAKARRDQRIARIAEISRGNRDLDIDQTYPVILADPPWKYDGAPFFGAWDRNAENHYPTLTLDEICALPVRDLATPDAILYLWTTAPKLAEALAVVEAWGFVYRTNITWDKGRPGLGYYIRVQHEHLLICTRGDMPTTWAGHQPASIIREPRGKHSEKPQAVYEIIEDIYPELAKIELFARTPRDGWTAWGNEIGVPAE